MEWITNHLGPQPLVPVEASVSQTKGSSYLKTILDSGKMERKMVYHPYQLCSPVSLNVEEESTLSKKWQFPFPVDQNLESRVKTLLDKVIGSTISAQRFDESNYKTLAGHTDTIEHRQLNPSSPDMLPSRLESPWTNEDYCLSDGRFRFLLDDSNLLWELKLQESLRASSDEIYLGKGYSNGEHPAVQLVAFCRLCRLYQSVFKPISIRLSYSDTNPVILVMNSSDAHQFTCTSTEITEIQDSPYGIEIPFIISELLGNSHEAYDRSRYILLQYDENYECWELVGCLNSFHSEPTTQETPFEHPSDILFVSVEDEDCVELLSNDHDIDVESLPEIANSVNTDPQLLDESTDAAMRQHFDDNSEEMDNLLLQDRLEHQIFSCPTFIFPSLFATMSPPITNDDDEPTPKEKEPAVETFKCDTCGKEFSNKNRLKTHQVIHDPAKWKQCFYCDYKTPRNLTMKNHVARFHWYASQKSNVG